MDNTSFLNNLIEKVVDNVEKELVKTRENLIKEKLESSLRGLIDNNVVSTYDINKILRENEFNFRIPDKVKAAVTRSSTC